MNKTWRTFLEQQGAQWDNHTLLNFPTSSSNVAECDTHTCIMPLVNYGIVKISGKDAASFMQSQFSNDLNNVNNNNAQLSGYCNPKGRLLASFIIFKFDTDYFLILDQALVANTVSRLRMFVMRSEVTLNDATDNLALIGINGKEANNALKAINLLAPTDIYQVNHRETASIIRIPGQSLRFILVSPIDSACDYWLKMTEHCRAATPAYWHRLTILAGQPEITANTVDTFVPQMVNLHVTNGVSFKKGCYPGQEIVARTQYLGKLKRRMYRVELAGNMNIEPGTDIYQSATDDTQSVGKVVMAAPISTVTVEALVVLQIAQADEHHDALHVGDKNGPKIRFLELPYSMT